MSQSISDIFSRSGETVKLPIGENESSETKDGNFIQKLKSYDKNEEIAVVDKALTSNTSIENIPVDQGSLEKDKISERYTAKNWGDKLFGGIANSPVGEIANAYRSLVNVTSKYVKHLPNGSAVLQLYNYVSTLGDNGTVNIPPYMSKDDGLQLHFSLGILKDKVIGSGSNVPRPAWNLVHGLDNISGKKGVTGLVGNALKIVGSNYLKNELEKAFYPARIPSEDLTNILVNNFYAQYGSDVSSSKGGNWLSSLTKVVTKALKFLNGNIENGYSAAEALNNLKKFNKEGRLLYDYGELNDPYRDEDYELPGETFADIFNSLAEESRNLNNSAYTASYYDFAGFELGSNHKWSISLFPYPHSENENEYNLNRGSLTPELPHYYLPDLWKNDTVDIISSSPKNNALSTILNSVKDNTIKEVEKHTINLANLNMDDYGRTVSTTPFFTTQFTGMREFSFNRLPALSFDFNMGTIKTESLKLFNGSSSEIFMGMNYNATLNISILDDVYNSMFKYFCHYVNSVYNIKTRSVAPYFRCAFEIWITIMQATGSRINHAYKLIGVPIEFTPRLDGQQDPNECRVDVTFGIIGLINPKDDRSINGGYRPANGMDGDLNWMDIQLQMK